VAPLRIPWRNAGQSNGGAMKSDIELREDVEEGATW
jgi:hypothetical protein